MRTGRDKSIKEFNKEDESNSAYSGSKSRGGSLNRQFNTSNGLGSAGAYGSNTKKNLKGNGKVKKGTKGKAKKTTKSNNRRGSSDGMDSHSESDEAVDDKGAIF